ncbi:hypothetical protein [Altererythrobacter sp. Root672]|uniref:hypothetical protein n=1 Tax=Altererythrobacter sp. Root672 TaxID=1736584 RepID=UPI0012E33A1A|nr:hypothetical protein [Altererythrobacter sp. Root672]
MTIQTFGVIKSASTFPAFGEAHRRMPRAGNRPISNIPIEELRRLVADMVD